MPKKPKLALIDAHALIHRAYHALPPMSTREGVPTNAVFGFTTMLLKIFSTLKPTHVAAAFDVKGPTFRSKEFKEYKVHRKKPDDELVVQFDLVRDVLKAFDIPVIEKKGFEADDVIGTIVERLGGKVRTVIITGDMDVLQLVNDDTTVFAPKRSVTDTVHYSAGLVREKYGFGPEHVVDYKGLAGDSSDNIPGVEGVGDKTARDLILGYGSVEGIYDKFSELPEKFQKKLKGKKKDALLSKKLATIKRDVPVRFELGDALLDGYDIHNVRQVFEKLGFRSLLAKLPEAAASLQPTLFGAAKQEAVAEKAVKMPKNYFLVESDKDRAALKKVLASAKMIAFDTENESLGARRYPIIGISFAIGTAKKTKAYYVPVGREGVKIWADIFENEKIKKTGHNLKYDIEVLRQSGVHVAGAVFDTMLASYLLHPGARAHGLDALALAELNHHMIPITELIGTGENQKLMSEAPLPELARYAAEDADISLQLYYALKKKIKGEKLERVLAELEVPLIDVLAEMELNGVRVDAAKLETLQKEVAKRIEKLRKTIWKEAGEEFNINSTQQLRVILYDKLNLPTADIKRTQTGFSTAASELNKLRGEHPIVELLEEYRELTKLQNTYIEVLPELVEEDGRIHGEFNQVVAATGRLSSQNPNLQNIPVRTELGQEIRSAFTAERGHRLVKADYSQIELRLAAHLSGDEKMIEAFRSGQDIHEQTARALGLIRRQAKTLNFGVLYGMGPQSFARAAGVSAEEARSFIGRYREQYAGLARFVEATMEETRATELVTTMFGRRRHTPEINSRAPAIRAQAERIAFNFPIQGSAADILKQAMIQLHAQLKKKFPEAKMVLTVHDELVVEAPKDEAEELAGDMKKIMEGVTTLDVPLVVDVAIGKNWRDMEAVA